MPIATEQVINILRNATGRIDASDPLFTDQIMLQYLNGFIVQLSSSDIRIFKNYTWWEFDYGPADPNPMPVDLQALKFSTIGPPAYVEYIPGVVTPPNNNMFELWWFQSPQNFFLRWPNPVQMYTPQRPTAVLYYNNELLFRNPLDQVYHFKIQAYKEELEIAEGSNIPYDYLYRYIAYGAALDLFSDYGEMDRWNEIFPAFKRYRALVYSRTYSQYQNQRPSPEF